MEICEASAGICVPIFIGIGALPRVVPAMNYLCSSVCICVLYGCVPNALAPASSPSKLELFRRFAPVVDLRRPEKMDGGGRHLIPFLCSPPLAGEMKRGAWPQALSVRLQSMSTASTETGHTRSIFQDRPSCKGDFCRSISVSFMDAPQDRARDSSSGPRS